MLLKDSLKSHEFESEFLLTSNVAKLNREEIFQWIFFSFNGQFSS